MTRLCLITQQDETKNIFGRKHKKRLLFDESSLFDWYCRSLCFDACTNNIQRSTCLEPFDLLLIIRMIHFDIL